MATDEEKIISYLSFEIGDELFAVHVNHVQSIMEMTEITKIPDAPEYMLGVINLRGEVVPVIDSRIKLRMKAREADKNTSILVLEVKLNEIEMRIGALVDSVQEVFEIEDQNIKNPPRLGNYYRSQFIYGMVEKNNKFVMLLDVDKIFSTKDLIELQEMSADMKAESTENQSQADEQQPSDDQDTNQETGDQSV